MAQFETIINGYPLTFITKPSLFSPTRPDCGTLAMLSQIESANGKILDLGCGYGLAGIYLAKRFSDTAVQLSDTDADAIACARVNAEANGVPDIKIMLSDGFRQITETGYTMIVCNPPYHTDFSVAKHFIEKGFNRLTIEGRLYMVTKRRDWYQRKLIALFGGVRITEQDGYFVFMAEKRSYRYANC